MNIKALHTISYGLYVIGCRKGDRLNGQTANTVIQVSSEPPAISVCINKGNLSHEFIKDSGVFTVSVLSQDTPLSFIGRFGFKSGRDINKSDGVSYRIGELVGAEVLRQGEPMTYAYYHQVKRGTTPKTAPVYIEERKEVGIEAAKYKCTVCGYVYDPEKGDPESGIAPGTPFEALPEDWVCPVCGTGKDEFEKEETS